jgi:hypothetical protein
MKLPLAKDFHAKCVSCGKQIFRYNEHLNVTVDQSPLLCGTPVLINPLAGSSFQSYGIFFCICDSCISQKINEQVVIQMGTVEDLLGPLSTD